jgi:integrase
MRGHLQRRGKNSWRFKFDAGRDANGKRITKYQTINSLTKAQAQAQAATLMAAAITGQFVDPSGETVGNFIERWLRDWALQNLSGKSFERYASLLRKHVVPHVGNLPIQQLRAVDLQQLYAKMGDHADRTRLYLHRVLSRMLKHAMQWGVVHQNVANKVDAPAVRANEIEVLTPAQVTAVLTSLEGRVLYPIVATALGTGARRGELLALRWRDVDLERGIIRIERSLEQTQANGITVRPPKTTRSRRSITLPAMTVDVLKAHRKAVQEQRLAMGLGKITPDLTVFAKFDGGLRSPRAVTKEWMALAKRLGLKVTFHSLRHTHCSTLISAGMDPVAISRRLGHSSPSITLNIYGHLFTPDDRAAEIMQLALTGGANPVS